MTPPARRITVVTGGARGIGATTVAELARAGHDLVVGYRDDRAAAMRTVADARDQGARAVAVAGDVTDEDAGQGIRVNAVTPRTVSTRIHADAGDPGRAERAAARIPLGRPGEPSEIAAAIAWLLSSEASYVTGASIRAAGGP